MTQLLEKALKAVYKLTSDKQNAIATLILKELESEQKWKTISGQKVADLKKEDTLFSDEKIYEGKAPSDLSANHDNYLYEDNR